MEWCEADQIILLVFLSASLALCYTQDIPCNIFLSTQRTRYSLPDFQGTNCIYSWTNSSGYVLANQNETETYPVLYSNITTLLTSRCFDQVHYTRDCTSEQPLRTARCFTNCSWTLELKNKGALCYHWTTVITVSFMVLVQLQLLPAAS